MARIERDREDLLREATALVPRVMLRMQLHGQPCEVFAGFRRESASIYFDASPVYHFNASGEVRRAFVDNRLIKAQSGRLVASVRQRSPGQVVLASTALSREESAQFLAMLTDRLNELRGILDRGAFEIDGEEPPDGKAITRLQAWLASWPGPHIADVANVK